MLRVCTLRHVVPVWAACATLACSSDRPPTAPAPNDPMPPPSPPQVVTHIAFVSTRDGAPHIYIATADGRNLRRLTRGEKPAWSPTALQIAFHRAAADVAGGAANLYVINVDGTGERLVAQGGANPSWSPDGSRIVFNGATGELGSPLFTVSPYGKDLTRLLAADFDEPGSPSSLVHPTWSPDGKQIAFVRASFDKPRLVFVVNADGTSPREITTFGSSDEPSWSPNGKRIAFGGFGASRTVMVMSADGSDRRVFAPMLAFDPDWSPEGDFVIYHSFSSFVGDEISPAGSRMRVYSMNVETGSTRQLIPEAESPLKANYWDTQAVWWRADPGIGWWDY